MRNLLPFVLLLIGLAGVVGVAAAATDLTGSRDPLQLERFPHAWIVDYERDDELLPREFIISRLDKTRREVRADRKIRTDARLESATYRIADGTPRQEVVDYYRELLGRDTLFSCEGRDCGRSNHWANYIFKQAILFGPDQNQTYIAVDRSDHLVAAYIVERGNRRVYVHVLALEPVRGPAAADNQGLGKHLDEKGFAVIDDVAPLADGHLPEPARQTLKALAKQLHIFAGERVYVVCHLYGAVSTAVLLAASERCSAEAAELLVSADGPELVAFAAGPLLPRGSGSASRIELILPQRMQRLRRRQSGRSR